MAAKNHWKIQESLEKVIPIPRSLHPLLKYWLQEANFLQGQPLHPLSHALQIFLDASREGWGTHVGDLTPRGTWSLPESKLCIYYLELKAFFLALKEFQDLCSSKIVLIATTNTAVVAYIHKKGGMRLDPLCPTVENPDLVFEESDDPQGPTHSRPVECGSRLAVQTRPDHPNRVVLLPEIFQSICISWH